MSRLKSHPLTIAADEGEVTISVKLSRSGATAFQAVSKVASGLAATDQGLIQSPMINCSRLNLRHTANFAQVHWCGEVFTFTDYQRRMVGALVAATLDDVEFLDTDTLNLSAERDSGTIWKVFEGHPAWGRWIVDAKMISRRPGTYRLEVSP